MGCRGVSGLHTSRLTQGPIRAPGGEKQDRQVLLTCPPVHRLFWVLSSTQDQPKTTSRIYRLHLENHQNQ